MNRKKKMGNVIYHIFIIAFAMLMLYPLLWMISASFKDTLEIFQGTDFLPRSIKFDNYRQGWAGHPACLRPMHLPRLIFR